MLCVQRLLAFGFAGVIRSPSSFNAVSSSRTSSLVSASAISWRLSCARSFFAVVSMVLATATS